MLKETLRPIFFFFWQGGTIVILAHSLTAEEKATHVKASFPLPAIESLLFGLGFS